MSDTEIVKTDFNLDKIIRRLENPTIGFSKSEEKEIQSVISNLRKIREVATELRNSQVIAIQAEQLKTLQRIEDILNKPVIDPNTGQLLRDSNGDPLRRIDVMEDKNLVNLIKAQSSAIANIAKIVEANNKFSNNVFVHGDINQQNNVMSSLSTDERYVLKRVFDILLHKVQRGDIVDQET